MCYSISYIQSITVHYTDYRNWRYLERIATYKRIAVIEVDVSNKSFEEGICFILEQMKMKSSLYCN